MRLQCQERRSHEHPKTIASEDRSEGRARTGASGSRGMNTEQFEIGLARYSDWAFTSSVVVLVVALLLLAVELAYSRGRKVEARELVGATVGADSATPGVVAAEPKRPLEERVGKGGLALVYV